MHFREASAAHFAATIDAPKGLWYIPAALVPWCSGQTCGPVKAEIASSNLVGTAVADEKTLSGVTERVFLWSLQHPFNLNGQRLGSLHRQAHVAFGLHQCVQTRGLEEAQDVGVGGEAVGEEVGAASLDRAPGF